ncbi:hypothetical protein LTR70_008801 [Exophiala xenobiotica]|uniref:NmrA-like domain-containing protein n=1 Tax=Lithohypha guttulata TaxID=1690604 RepID=A0ABR0JZ97_9EURO|nr:hypothetical protein LTR24_008664 [Lithohypha guttulata]KAK5311440.1 hypothetical protein LTR70_008801 [Exophiala xenobiotica]
MSRTRTILILGAGELGAAITTSLLAHPAYDSSNTSLTFVVRPETLTALDTESASDRIKSLKVFRSKGVRFKSTDLVSDPEEALAKLFRQYTCVIHAGAMTLPQGTQLKVTRAALAAEVDEFTPWQWGVDYDIIGKSGGLGLFAEQCEVRELLRAQNQTKWFILSCGVFMSFLFEEFWGVVVRDDDGEVSGVRALGGWDHKVTATTVEDIARCNAELVLVDSQERGKAVYIAGDTMRYDEFADAVVKIVGREVGREVWTTEWLKEQAKQEPEKKLWKYRVVFSEDQGLAWEKNGTYNDVKGIDMEAIEAYMDRMGMR